MTVWIATTTVPKVFTLTARHMRQAETAIRNASEEKSAILKRQKILWASEIIDLVGIEPTVIGPVPDFPTPAIFVGNHIGFFDIPLLMSLVPVCFVAKRELRKWLVIGRGCELTETILVDRSCEASRRRVSEQIGKVLKEERKQVCIFPSGTTCINEDIRWRAGAFQIAQHSSIPVVPFRLRYDPIRPAAYIKNDNLIMQLWRSQRARPIRAEIEFHPPVAISNPREDCDYWQRWTREFLS